MARRLEPGKIMYDICEVKKGKRRDELNGVLSGTRFFGSGRLAARTLFRREERIDENEQDSSLDSAER